MPDYECWPLWQPGGEPYALSPDDLALSQVLRDRLAAWASTYDSHLCREYPPDTHWSHDDAAAFDAEGQVLLSFLHAELGPAFMVSYYIGTLCDAPERNA